MIQFRSPPLRLYDSIVWIGNKLSLITIYIIRILYNQPLRKPPKEYEHDQCHQDRVKDIHWPLMRLKISHRSLLGESSYRRLGVLDKPKDGTNHNQGTDIVQHLDGGPPHAPTVERLLGRCEPDARPELDHYRPEDAEADNLAEQAEEDEEVAPLGVYAVGDEGERGGHALAPEGRDIPRDEEFCETGHADGGEVFGMDHPDDPS